MFTTMAYGWEMVSGSSRPVARQYGMLWPVICHLILETHAIAVCRRRKPIFTAEIKGKIGFRLSCQCHRERNPTQPRFSDGTINVEVWWLPEKIQVGWGIISQFIGCRRAARLT